MLAERGVLYVAVGDAHERMAAASARSIKEHSPGLPTALICGTRSDGAHHDAFDEVEQSIDPFGWPQRINAMMRTPFERTLYLDSDTLVLEPIDDVLRVLERYDVGVALAPARSGPPDPDGLTPDAFYMPNSGMFAYRRAPAAERWMPAWLELYERAKREHPGKGVFVMDQAAMRWALWRTRTSTYVFPPEYNVRGRHPAFLRDRAVIAHEVDDELAWLAELYNWKAGRRVFPPLAEGAPGSLVSSVRRAPGWLDACVGLLSDRPSVFVDYGGGDGHASLSVAQRSPLTRVLSICRGGASFTRFGAEARGVANLRLVASADVSEGIESWCAREGIGRVDVLRIGTDEQRVGLAPLDERWLRGSVGAVVRDGSVVRS